jgi:hypothetical protein
MNSIKYTCSLGTKCFSSQLLKRNNLKKESYPFDWIFSDLDIIIDCIKDDFIIFLDKSYYVDIQDKWNDNQCGHKYYHPNMFNHHDPRNEKDYQYFVRCVDRFNNLLYKLENKLFIISYLNLTNVNKSIINDILQFNEKFKNYTQNYRILCIVHYNCEYTGYVFSTIHNIDILTIHTNSPTNGVDFNNKEDNEYIDNIIKEKYRFDF